MSESAKEVFERIPEARRDAAVREADERCHGLYARAWQENCGDVFEKNRVAFAAEDAARATVFARFVEPVAPMQPVTGDCYHSSQNWRRESDGIHCDECEAAEGVYAASVLASRVGHRIAKRWIVRLSRTTRIHYEKRYRDMFPRRRR